MTNDADPPYASCPPEEPAETLADRALDDYLRLYQGRVRDAIARWRGDIEKTLGEIRQINRLVLEHALELAERERSEEARLSALEACGGLLGMIADNENGALYAHCLMLLINRNPNDEAKIARRFGVTRAAVSKIKIDLEKRFSLTSRIGRSEEAREKFRKINSGKKRRKEKCNNQSFSELKIA